ncbi:MAG: membrane protein insertion efficiency factor YidD [Nitrospirae bacterium]|nr:membrane protein insertion efficiency factor YidD [Nitrospirota bacterium]
MGSWKTHLEALVIFAVKNYKKYISPFLPSVCRFYPSCSSYAIEAIEECGFFKGLRLSIKRVIKCHPFHPGGYDPVSTDSQRIKLRKDKVLWKNAQS